MEKLSAKTIEDGLVINHDIALEIEKEIGNIMGHKEVYEVYRALQQINALLNGRGVRSIRDNIHQPPFLDIGLFYIDLGDTYIPTIVYDTREDGWFICPWSNQLDTPLEQVFLKYRTEGRL